MSKIVYLTLNIFISRRAAKNAELASRFALAVGLAADAKERRLRRLPVYRHKGVLLAALSVP